MSKNTFYVTTPIYYVTAKPHLGSLYSTVIADTIARWKKLNGNEVFFLTGTDEYGQKIAQAAQEAGKTPQVFVDSFIDAYKSTWKTYHIDYSYFMRTTAQFHIKAVQEWIEQLIKTGDIYKSYYKGWYCVPDETFVTEKEFNEAEAQSSDQGPACPHCGRPTIAVQEETYFFKLSAYEQRLLEFYKKNPNFIVPKERFAEVINFVKAGLKDLSISRTTVKWGVPFLNDSKHVAYVWADALNNYITGIGYNQPERRAEFEKWWPAKVHVMGKDIVRFHAIYWPAFLMAVHLPLPQKLLVHGWILVDKHKMSKSRKNVVDPVPLQETYGADQIRYYLLKQLAINQDGDFTTADLEKHITSDLANDLGNLLNRLTALAEKNNSMHVPAPAQLTARTLELQKLLTKTIADYSTHMNEYYFHIALAVLWRYISAVNAYFHEHEPWKLPKSNPALFMEVMSATSHSLRAIAYLLIPVMPEKMKELLSSLTISDITSSLSELALTQWNQDFKLIKINTLFIKPEPTESESPMETEVTPKPQEAIESFIEFTDFIKCDLRVGTVVECKPVEQSDKLLQLQVDFGPLGTRQILAGVKQSITPEQLVGTQGVFVVNLKPRKMAGLESQGMMLVAKPTDGSQLKPVTVAHTIGNGWKLY